MRAYDWLVFARLLAAYAMRDCLPASLLNVFLRFTECMARLTAREYTNEDLPALQEYVVEFLVLLELHFPKSELTIVFHLMVHAVSHIELWGPLSALWMFPYERFLGFLCRTIKNRTFVAATVVRFYRVYSYTQSQRARVRQFMAQTAVGTDYVNFSQNNASTMIGAHALVSAYRPTNLRFHGSSHSRTLSVDEYNQLSQAFRWSDSVYGRLCHEYEASVPRSERKGRTMAEWTPARDLTDAEKAVLGGPSRRVTVFPQATVRGVEFRSALAESGMTSRSSYFSFTSVDEKDTLRTEYGRVLQFWEIRFGGVQRLMVRVDIFKYGTVKPAVVSPGYQGVQFELPMVDSSKLDSKRHVLPLEQIRSQVLLAPPDDRLSEPDTTRLVGPCFILEYLNC